MIMPDDKLQKRMGLDTKSAGMRDAYRRLLQRPKLSDHEIDDMRKHLIRLAQVICEHVWGKRFY